MTSARSHLSRLQAAGFTLLEMVLVLFLVGLLASAGLLFTENVEQRADYEETQRRMAAIKRAIIGDPNRTIDNSPEISGFISDVGRLPLCLKELITLGEVVDIVDGVYASPCDDDAENNIRIWQLNTETGRGSGWRGPYLQGEQEDSGVSTFRDGYSNVSNDPVEDDLNFGWQRFEADPVTGEVQIVSSGFDLSSAADDISATLTNLNDYILTLGNSWGNVSTILNFDSLLTFQEFRLKLSFPVGGAPESWPATEAEREVSRSLSSVFPTLNISSVTNAEITVPLSTVEKIRFSAAINKSGDEITLVPGTVISYTTESAPLPEDYIDEYKVASYCNGACTIEISNLAEPDGNFMEVTPGASSEILASTNVIAFIANNLAKRAIKVPDGSSISGTTLTLPNTATISLPANSSSAVSNNTVVLGGDTITVSEAFTLADRTVTTTTSGDVFAVPAGTASSGNDLIIPASLSLPLGVHSLTVVCENNGHVYVDGTCDEANFSNATEDVVVIPRTSGPVKPEPFLWGGL